jgi:glycosyltransferase involved in cell wall biosynthesis
MKLLFITQKLHGQDAFGVLWANAFAARGYDVTVLCLEWQPEKMREVLPGVELNFKVLSMGKDKGIGKVGVIFNFWKHILAHKSDRVFVHMAPVWGLLGAPVWIIRRTPAYLWYTHYKMQAGLWLMALYGKRLFCATEQSMPMYPSTSSGQVHAKKVVTGHGIDRTFWPRRENHTTEPHKLLMVHRLARSKRAELCIKALTHLLTFFTLDIYGQEVEPDYAAELKALVAELGLAERVRFLGSAPVKDLPEIYTHHQLILNMASETIDKTMLEAMTCGCYPVTTGRNAQAIGIPGAPHDDTPEAIAAFVQEALSHAPLSAEEMDRVVEQKHSLRHIVEVMDSYMHSGT